ncbi:hypothetical protein QJS66_18495 [Kocuria rhizophila]|nr:hypothetical protein QJS66_18495 [Kocuria rhizophila]
MASLVLAAASGTPRTGCCTWAAGSWVRRGGWPWRPGPRGSKQPALTARVPGPRRATVVLSAGFGAGCSRPGCSRKSRPRGRSPRSRCMSSPWWPRCSCGTSPRRSHPRAVRACYGPWFLLWAHVPVLLGGRGVGAVGVRHGDDCLCEHPASAQHRALARGLPGRRGRCRDVHGGACAAARGAARAPRWLPLSDGTGLGAASVGLVLGATGDLALELARGLPTAVLGVSYGFMMVAGLREVELMARPHELGGAHRRVSLYLHGFRGAVRAVARGAGRGPLAAEPTTGFGRACSSAVPVCAASRGPGGARRGTGVSRYLGTTPLRA